MVSRNDRLEWASVFMLELCSEESSSVCRTSSFYLYLYKEVYKVTAIYALVELHEGSSMVMPLNLSS